jgi:hypothetical protein
VHQFLKAIGFSKIKKDELECLFMNIVKHPDSERSSTDSEGNEFVEITKEFAPNLGIALRGTYRNNQTFELSYYFPYFQGNNLSTQETIDVEKHAEKESYAGICDEVRVGITLIFYLQNVVEYLSYKKANRYGAQGAVLAGLSIEGKILLPICKDEIPRAYAGKSGDERTHLLAAARDGDQDAIENLTLEDIDTYSLISKRIQHEDVLSIVESSFMPYGIESDQYAIIGEIMDVRKVYNSYSGEALFILEIECNDVTFGICINEMNLLGEPKVGRRFKGVIWMQGMIKY